MISQIINTLVYWMFCKLDDPIYSPSLSCLYGVKCLHCGKRHGTLLKLNISIPFLGNLYDISESGMDGVGNDIMRGMEKAEKKITPILFKCIYCDLPARFVIDGFVEDERDTGTAANPVCVTHKEEAEKFDLLDNGDWHGFTSFSVEPLWPLSGEWNTEGWPRVK